MDTDLMPSISLEIFLITAKKHLKAMNDCYAATTCRYNEMHILQVVYSSTFCNTAVVASTGI